MATLLKPRRKAKTAPAETGAAVPVVPVLAPLSALSPLVEAAQAGASLPTPLPDLPPETPPERVAKPAARKRTQRALPAEVPVPALPALPVTGPEARAPRSRAKAATTLATQPETLTGLVQEVLQILSPAPASVPVPVPVPVADPAPAAAEPRHRRKQPAKQALPVAPVTPLTSLAPAAPIAPSEPEETAKPAAPVVMAPTPAAPAAPVALRHPESAPTGPAHSAVILLPGDAHRVVWQVGHACPPAVHEVAKRHVDADQCLAADDDTALPQILRAAQQAGHRLVVDPAVWPHLAAHRDARSRLALLEAAYPAGPASPALLHLLAAPLASFQAEGALFAVVAGRALLADERGLGKSVQAIAATTLWQQHFGLQRVLLVCAATEVTAWQRAWQRFAPAAPGRPVAQHMDGGLHHRQALWSQPAGLRILSPEALASDAAHLVQWAPELVIVDEPQRLALRPDDWAALAAPHALVLCGAPLAEQAALMDQLVRWLDEQRLGPLAALQELQAAAAADLPLEEADIDRLTAQLSRLMLQRSRQDVAAQLPAVVHSERLFALAPGQREAHDTALAGARQALAPWQRSGCLADGDQWRLLQALAALQSAALRAQPGHADSALADAVVQAVATQLDDWAGTVSPADDDSPGFRALVLCPTAADRDQLAARLTLPPGVSLALSDEPWPAGLSAVVQLGVPWRTRRAAVGVQPGAGQQWVSLVAQGSLDAGLFNTLAQRQDLARSLLDGGQGFLQGEALQRWLRAVQAALDAATPVAAS